MKFKVMGGKHHEGSHKEKTHVCYNRGDVIETDADLAAMFNRRGYPPKFMRVSDDTPAKQRPEPKAEQGPEPRAKPISERQSKRGKETATA